MAKVVPVAMAGVSSPAAELLEVAVKAAIQAGASRHQIGAVAAAVAGVASGSRHADTTLQARLKHVADEMECRDLVSNIAGQELAYADDARKVLAATDSGLSKAYAQTDQRRNGAMHPGAKRGGKHLGKDGVAGLEDLAKTVESLAATLASLEQKPTTKEPEAEDGSDAGHEKDRLNVLRENEPSGCSTRNKQGKEKFDDEVVEKDAPLGGVSAASAVGNSLLEATGASDEGQFRELASQTEPRLVGKTSKDEREGTQLVGVKSHANSEVLSRKAAAKQGRQCTRVAVKEAKSKAEAARKACHAKNAEAHKAEDKVKRLEAELAEANAVAGQG